MFYHLEGVVSEIDQNLIVLDCAGIGFALNTSMNTIAAVQMGEIANRYFRRRPEGRDLDSLQQHAGYACARCSEWGCQISDSRAGHW